jgi:Protein of unknown function (DUF2950)
MLFTMKYNSTDETEKSMMRTHVIFNTSRPGTLASRARAITLALLILASTQSTFAQSRPKTFVSASQASQALYEAVKNKDDQAVQAILGAGPELTSSGDDSTDRLERERFAQKYQEMHRLVRQPDGSAVLYIGAENWPFPIPLVAKNGNWHFDPDAGGQEVLARRVGEDEISAIDVCQAFRQATGNGAEEVKVDDPIERFARKLVSAGNVDSTNIEFFRGYYFRVVSEQPASLMVVAYPAEYRVTGVMTFIVVGGGYVYEKNLGPKTTALASQIHGKPTAKWSAVKEGQEQPSF